MLLDCGCDKPHLTQKFGDALQVQHPKDIILPIASFDRKHSVKTADVMIVTEILYSSCPLIRIPVYATGMEEFSMPGVQIEMLSEICRDQFHIKNKCVPIIRDKGKGIPIGDDAIMETVLRQFTSGHIGSPYGVITLLVLTLTGPIPHK